jgi:hypothetical protein
MEDGSDFDRSTRATRTAAANLLASQSLAAQGVLRTETPIHFSSAAGMAIASVC